MIDTFHVLMKYIWLDKKLRIFVCWHVTCIMKKEKPIITSVDVEEEVLTKFKTCS